MSEPEIVSCDVRRTKNPPNKSEAKRAWNQIGIILDDGSLRHERGRVEFDAHMAQVMAYRWAQTPR